MPTPLPDAGGAEAFRLHAAGPLAAAEWRLKLYVPSAEAEGLRPDDVAIASRAFRAGVAAPERRPVAGFAVLRAAPVGVPGSLSLALRWWDAAGLHGAALLLPGDGGPPRREAGVTAGRIGSLAEVGLLAREYDAWRRHVLDAPRPSLAAYLDACCA